MLEQVLERIAAALEKQNELSLALLEAQAKNAEAEAMAAEHVAASGPVAEDKPKRTRRTKAEIEAAEAAKVEAATNTEGHPAALEAKAHQLEAAKVEAAPQQGVAVESPSVAEADAGNAYADVEGCNSPVGTPTSAPSSAETASHSEPEAPSVTWAQALEAIKQVNASDKPSGGRNGVIKVMVEFGVIPKEVDHTKDGRVPELEKTGKFAEIKAFAESLLKQEDLGL